MSKINQLTISNFKFFRGEETIKLDGKHLLLYGENGSGKSSIFWGLHMLLEASMKAAVDTEKYFKPIDKSDESLVNLYAKKQYCVDTGIEHYNTFVEVEDDNGNKQHISMLHKGICGDATVMESRKTTDFINYQSLFAFQRFKNSQSSNVYNVFNESILPYIDFDTFSIKGKVLYNALDMWNEYMAGPGKTTNAKGDDIQVYKSSQEYKNFVKFEKHFNDKLSNLIDFINSESEPILVSLGYDINFELKYTAPWHHKKDKSYDFREYRVDFVLTKYNGNIVNINRPHKFLNEAKLTAIAIAIRLAVLKYKVQNSTAPNALNVLALDDIMVSLDMSNRDKLIGLIVNDLSQNYQILLLTHDKGLYNYIFKEISQSRTKSGWVYKKMYVGECDKTQQEFPVVVDEKGDYLTRASKFFQAKEYTISALCLRKALEKILVTALPPDSLKSINNDFVDLEALWKKVVNMYNLSTSHIDLCQSATKIKRVILNPSAHYKREYQPLYRKELKDAFKFINDLQGLNLSYKITTILIEKGQYFIYTHPNENYSFEFEIESNLTMENGTINDPRCVIHTWQYNGIEYYDFSSNVTDDSYKQNKPKFSRLKNGLFNLPLSIDEDNFVANTFVDGSNLGFLLNRRTINVVLSEQAENTMQDETPINNPTHDTLANVDITTVSNTTPSDIEAVSTREVVLSDFDIERLNMWTSGDDPQFFQIHFMGGGAIYSLGSANKYEIKNGKEKIEWDAFFEKLIKLGLIDIEKRNKDGYPVYRLKQAAYEYVEKLSK
ncbi:MAG: AAA family ATPase [Rikenellaceae bacterium]